MKKLMMGLFGIAFAKLVLRNDGELVDGAVWMRCFGEMEGVAGRKVGSNFGEFSYVLATVYRSKLGTGQLGSRPFCSKTAGSKCFQALGPH